jgi:phosphoribosylamine--glycine ligase
MNILIIGGGGREHALVWKVKQSPLVKSVYCAPGNPGTAALAENIDIDVNDFAALADFAMRTKIDLTVVGPEDPLVKGIVDYFSKKRLTIFGPDKKAAQLEGSKVFSKTIMENYHIPTAAYRVFTVFEQAAHYIDQVITYPLVVKASGLAAGKGVVICQNKAEAQHALRSIMQERVFGTAGDQVIIEDFLTGNEVSIFALCDGSHYLLLSPSQDHKKVFEGDQGKNTGGMGAYAPTPLVNNAVIEQIKKTIIAPTLSAMQSEEAPYRGLLYFGLILTDKGPKVLEYNCRFGDPETEVVLPLLENDLVPLLLAATEGTLKQHTVQFLSKYAIDVVLSSGGYPEVYEKGKEISGLNRIPDDMLVFHAGTALKGGKLVTSGGRVLNMVAIGADFMKTRDYLYQHIQSVHFDKMHFRRDIGFRVLNLFQEGVPTNHA